MKKIVLRAFLLGFVLCVDFVWAEAPMDLDSPFIKTVLIQGSLGEISEKTVQKGKVVGDMIEFEKEDNSLLVLPKSSVLAVLPRIPGSDIRHLQSDSVRALQVLEKAQKLYPARIEVSPGTLAQWRKMSEQKTETDQAELQALQAWLLLSGSISPQAKKKEIQELVDQGEVFADKFPDQAEKILEQIKGLRELSKIDLLRVANLKFQLGSLGENFVPGAILWGILLIPLIFVLQGVLGAVQGFKEGLPLAGLSRFLVALLGAGFMAAIFWPSSFSSASALIDSEASRVSPQRAFLLSRNLVEQWGDQSAQKIAIDLDEWKSFLLKTIEPGAEDLNTLFWRLQKPRVEIKNGKALVLLPVVMKIIPINLWFQFIVPPKGQALDTAELEGFRVGSLPLGSFIGRLVLPTLSTAFEAVHSGYGLDKGARWTVGEGGALVVEVPAVRQKRPQAKESITAKELAELFDQGFGEIYVGKIITIEGNLVDVSSSHETIGNGTTLKKEDPMDEFILEGIPEGLSRKYALRIRCQFKSSDTYFLDSKGDLYKSSPKSQNPETDTPLLRQVQGNAMVRLSGGRVDSKPSENRVVTIYDCRKIEGLDEKDWRTLWP